MKIEELNAITLTKRANSEVELVGEIPFAYLARYRSHAVEHVQHGMELPGFRPGHIPESILIQKIGEMPILNDMAEHTLQDAYREMVTHFNLDVIGHPKVTITKLAKDNPLGFHITVAVLPEVTLPDYKNVAHELNKNRESKEVTEEEVTKQIEDILRQKVAYERLQAKAARKAEGDTKNETDGDITLPTPPSDAPSDDTIDDPSKLPLPELTDEYVKTLGNPGQFNSVTEFREKIKEHLTLQKAQDVDSAHRVKLTDAIIEKTEVVLPQIMIDAEMNQMFAQMESDLTRANLKIDDYLAHIKKSKEDLVREWTPAAEKRAKLQLVLNAIAKKEEVKADPSLVDHQVSSLLSQYKDADEERVRIYVTSILVNDAVMEMLNKA